MKKVNGLILIIAVVALLTGCFNDENNDVLNNNGVENNGTSSGNVIQENDKEFSIGEWNNNVYTNEFLNIKYTLPEGWERNSNEELIKIMNIDESIKFGSDEFIEKVENNRTVYYMISNDYNTGNRVDIITEKRTGDISVEEYLSEIEETFKNIETETYEGFDTNKENIGNLEYNTLYITLPKYNIHQKYYVRKQDNRFIAILISSRSLESLNNIIQSFE